MLGITIPDAVLIGTLVISLLAAWRGSKAGAAAKESTLPEPTVALIGSAIVDTATLRDLVEAVRRLAEVIDRAAGRAERTKTDRLEGLLDEILHSMDRSARR